MKTFNIQLKPISGEWDDAGVITLASTKPEAYADEIAQMTGLIVRLTHDIPGIHADRLNGEYFHPKSDPRTGKFFQALLDAVAMFDTSTWTEKQQQYWNQEYAEKLTYIEAAIPRNTKTLPAHDTIKSVESAMKLLVDIQGSHHTMSKEVFAGKLIADLKGVKMNIETLISDEVKESLKVSEDNKDVDPEVEKIKKQIMNNFQEEEPREEPKRGMRM